LLTPYLTNRWWEICQIYNFGAVGVKDDLITCWDQKVRG